MPAPIGFSATADTVASARLREAGLGLIEIVVSMFLIALLAMAFLPLLIQSLRATVTNTSVASATQLVSQQLEQVRTVGSTCSAITTFASTDPASVTDDRGVVLSIERQLVGACPTTFPGTIGFRVIVAGDGEALSDATTRILVTGP